MNPLQLPWGALVGERSINAADWLFAQSGENPAIDPWLLVITLVVIIVLLILWHSVTNPGFAGRIQDKEALARAEALLRESLTREEYQQLQRDGYLEIPSTLYPHRLYRIPREQRRVQVYTCSAVTDRPSYHKLAELCVVAYDPVPYADLFLAQKWMLESNEKGYLSIANWIG